jgi:DNA repair and recombination protein RAD54 and RAD54-like protein
VSTASVSHSTLVKWLGPDAISALAIDGKGSKAEMLQRVARWVAANGRNVSQPGTTTHFTCEHLELISYILYTVMIVSYETLRTLTVHLNNCRIGLLLCDEGHRLKNSGKPFPY